MNFTDKVTERYRLNVSESEWDDGLRFVFDDMRQRHLIGTEWTDFADIMWRSNTMKGEDAIRIIAWMDLGEDELPSGRCVQEYYDTNKLIEAFKWLAENTF